MNDMTKQPPIGCPEIDRIGVDKLALIVDDEPTNRMVLAVLLSQMNFSVVEAQDGYEAIQHFTADKPDIIFMDIMMPGMDGYEATSRIKHLSGDHFVPIIVLTAMSDEDALAKCIASGGDDVMTKPYDSRILQSKIHAMLRISALQDNVSELYAHIRHEQVLAEKIFTKAVMKHNVESSALRSLLRPASVFSGDLVLTAYSPGGDLHVLLGDFTGHGLSAAIGALPTSDIFRAMASKGYEGHAILTEINEKLCKMLPVEIFMAAAYIYIPQNIDHIAVLNCGLPDVLYITNDSSGCKINQRFPATSLPLGITKSFPEDHTFKRFSPEMDSSLFICSDGLIEGRNVAGEEFGEPRLAATITSTKSIHDVFDNVLKDITVYCQKESQHDDITFIEVPLDTRLFNFSEQPETVVDKNQAWNESESENKGSNSYSFSLVVSGARLCHVELLPTVMSTLKEIKLPQEVLTESYTILSELLVNALDHGVLGLESSLKSKENGFTLYLEERTKRLEAEKVGSIEMDVDIRWYDEGGSLTFDIKDSGKGFDYEKYVNEVESVNLYSGRGILLIRALCESVDYQAPGNKVKAVYRWKN